MLVLILLVPTLEMTVLDMSLVSLLSELIVV